MADARNMIITLESEVIDMLSAEVARLRGLVLCETCGKFVDSSMMACGEKTCMPCESRGLDGMRARKVLMVEEHERSVFHRLILELCGLLACDPFLLPREVSRLQHRNQEYGHRIAALMKRATDAEAALSHQLRLNPNFTLQETR